MPIITESLQSKADQYFEQFLAAYPTPEDRYEGTLRLANANTVMSEDLLLEDEYRSRNFILAHYRLDDKGLRAAADYVYTLAKAVRDSFYYPAMVFRKGSPEDISSDSYLPPELKIEYGVVNNKNIEHLFKAEMDPLIRIARQGIRPRYLGYGVGIKVCRAQLITADLGMESCATKPIDGNPALLACFGTVSLEKKLELGELAHAEEERVAVIGKDKCRTVIDKLIKLCQDSDEETIENLENMARGYSLRP